MPVSDYDALYQAAGKEWNVDPTLLKAMSHQESGGDPRIVSAKGATGLMQLMPDTGKEMGVVNPNDPEQNIFGGAKYLRQMLDKYGSPETALAAYNAGPGRMDAVLAGKASMPAETANYVPAVTAHYQRFAQAAPAGNAPASSPAASAAQDPSGMSDDDFLKHTTSSGAAPKTEDDDAFMARTGAKAGKLEKPPVQANMAGVDDLGRPISAGDAPVAPGKTAEAIGRVSTATGEGVARGFGSEPLGLSPTSDQALVNAGVFNGPNEYNPLKGINRALIGGGAAAGDLALRAGNALMGGYQGLVSQGGAEVGAPQLGRDLAALPEAFPTGNTAGEARILAAHGAQIPGRPNPLAVAADVDRPYLPAQLEAPPVTTGGNLLAADSVKVPVVARDGNKLSVTYAEQPAVPGSAPAPASANPNVSQPPAPAGNALAMGAAGGGPQSVGAAASRDTTSPGAMPPETPAQKLTSLEKSVNQTAEDRAGPQLQDHTVYVPDVERSHAAREFSPQNSLDDKTLRATDPVYRAAQERIERDANATMVDKLRNDALDPNAIKAAHDERDLVAPSAQRLFEGEKPVDAAGLVKDIDGTLAGPDGKRGAITRTLKSVRDSLHDADGNLETLPSQLYGARKNITDMLKKGVGDGADDVRASKAVLSGLLDKIDSTINEGAPKYQAYLNDFHQASQPINQMEFLQQYQTGSKKLTNVDGYLQLNKVQKMLDDVYQGRKAKGINSAKSLTDDQIQNIINVRNELAANSMRDRLAKVKGSDTTQQVNRAGVLGDGPLGTAVKGGAELAMHGALMASPAAGWGNALLSLHRNVVKPAVAASKAQKAANLLAGRKAQLLTTAPNLLNPP